ncbi:hypothetical protein FNV43_RR07448 [Rhamnella rubrinervis]|uniref:Uncharacterized protein n=1 Tax=Rhamnella rubrinervis TaxID=2594499 RepID=A0A8K0HFW5_9ROSA|nr:hypothetical protein FNV43_RR07448 [Rhamnella rubrinervis]
MTLLKRLMKASEKSTKAMTTTTAAATKKISREVKKSFNALQESTLAKWLRLSKVWLRVPSLYRKEGFMKHYSQGYRGDCSCQEHFQLLYNDDSHIVEFEFNGVGIKFDMKAIAMITGLNCGKFLKESKMMNSPYSLWIKYRVPVVSTMTPLEAFLGVKYPRMLGYLFPNSLEYNRLTNNVFNKKQVSMHGYCMKNLQRNPNLEEDMEQFEYNIDYASEMNDTPFGLYYARDMPIGSLSRAYMDIDSSSPRSSRACHTIKGKMIRSIIAGDAFHKHLSSSGYGVTNIEAAADSFRRSLN